MHTSRNASFAAAAVALTVISALAATAPLGAQTGASKRLTLGGTPPTVTTEAELHAFLDDLEAQEFAVGTALGIEAYYQWRGQASHRVAPTARLANDLLNRPDYAAIVDSWRGRVQDSTLARRLELHHRAFLQAKADPGLVIAFSDLQAALQDTVEQFRFQLRGQRYTYTAINEIVDTAPDRATRRDAFVTGPQRAAVIGATIRRGMQLYDSIGRQEGFPSGVDAGLTFATLSRAQVISDIDAFERATRPAYVALLDRVRRDLRIDRVEPWDIGYWLHVREHAVADAYPQAEGVRRLLDLARALGFHVDSLPIDVRVWDVPTGGVTFWTRAPFEARLLTNPFTGSDFYETLFHEYGHALNAVLLRPDLSPIFLNGDETPLGEGSAETLGHFAYDRHWLEREAHVSPGQAVALERIGKAQLLLWLRRTICLNAWFELHAYDDLRADLNALYHESYRRFVGVELPSGDYFGNRDGFATGPAYYQSYLYANMIAAQFRAAMRSAFHVEDLSREPRVADWLTAHVFADGARIPWPDKIVHATGRPLTVAALVEYLTSQ